MHADVCVFLCLITGCKYKETNRNLSEDIGMKTKLSLMHLNVKTPVLFDLTCILSAGNNVPCKCGKIFHGINCSSKFSLESCKTVI